MVRHIVKVLDDGALATGEGWALVRCRETGDLYFLVEHSAASREEVLRRAWETAAALENDELRAAVVEGMREVV